VIGCERPAGIFRVSPFRLGGLLGAPAEKRYWLIDFPTRAIMKMVL